MKLSSECACHIFMSPYTVTIPRDWNRHFWGKQESSYFFPCCQRRQASEFLFWTGTPEKNPGATNDLCVGHQWILGFLEPTANKSKSLNNPCVFYVFSATRPETLSFEPPFRGFYQRAKQWNSMPPGGWEPPGTETDSQSEGEEELSVVAGNRQAKSPQKKTRVRRRELGWKRVWEGRSYNEALLFIQTSASDQCSGILVLLLC